MSEFEDGLTEQVNTSIGSIWANGNVQVVVNSPDAEISGASAIKPLDEELGHLLAMQVEGCVVRDVKFRSVHFVAALLKMKHSFTVFCLDQVSFGFAKNTQQMIDNFIARQAKHDAERGFLPVDISTDPILSRAAEIAHQEKSMKVDDRHTLLSFLRSTSVFRDRIFTDLGPEHFKQLLEVAKNRFPTQTSAGLTSDILFDEKDRP